MGGANFSIQFLLPHIFRNELKSNWNRNQIEVDQHFMLISLHIYSENKKQHLKSISLYKAHLCGMRRKRKQNERLRCYFLDKLNRFRVQRHPTSWPYVRKQRSALNLMSKKLAKISLCDRRFARAVRAPITCDLSVRTFDSNVNARSFARESGKI